MRRPWHALALFASFVVVLVAALSWISLMVIRLERADREARARALLEENVRLALWRMDSSLGSVLAQENGRSFADYFADYPVQWAYDPAGNLLPYGEVRAPSPLLFERPPNVRVHFQLDENGQLTSPQVEGGQAGGGAGQFPVSEGRAGEIEGRLAELSGMLDRGRLIAALPAPPEQPANALAQSFEENAPAPVPFEQQQAVMSPQQQRTRSGIENVLRKSSARQLAEAQTYGNAFPVYPVGNPARVAPMTPLWIDDALLLLRRVDAGGAHVIQGCWLDWEAIRAGLLARVQDLLPQAQLVPAPESVDEGQDPTRLLAALPVRLEPGELPVGLDDQASPIRVTLLVAWIGSLLAVLAAGALLLGTLALSERRAAFVSAVTHELRTPLTTFRLYTELMADERAVPPDKQRQYIQTLHGEAGRLTNLVENVLAFSRLERNGRGARAERIRVSGLLDRVLPRLADRATAGGMRLEAVVPSDAGDARVCVDIAAVERILFNLVENACKYAASAADRLVRISVHCRGAAVLVRVCDHGPGVSRRDARILFRPFHRTRRSASDAAGGVGLGLALGRRLARSMGGELRLDAEHRNGACFELRLPSD